MIKRPHDCLAEGCTFRAIGHFEFWLTSSEIIVGPGLCASCAQAASDSDKFLAGVLYPVISALRERKTPPLRIDWVPKGLFQ
jgi:hypothetical protein